jgi:SpoVK/Ycf46/Vps4 family AAA+-type ATPase
MRGKPLLDKDLVIIIEGAEMLIPEGDVSHLSDADRKRVAVCRDWFSDPGFQNGGDSVVLVTESRSNMNQMVARLPQMLEVEIPSPDQSQREHFISWFIAKQPPDRKPGIWASEGELATITAGLSIQSIRQLLKECSYTGETLQPAAVVGKVEEYLRAQLGEDVVEFHKPAHTLKDVVGNRVLKQFLKERLIPRLKRMGKRSISGAAVAGALGAGKTFIFEAVASELGVPVLVLKNIRSTWFGQTDVIFERLRRCLIALSKVLIFMDEADTQMGGVGMDIHETERRLTGKIQSMMSDPKLRGRVIWLLMTARIHLLSEDLRRPGRAGDLIVPVLDPEGEDREEFVKWLLQPVAPDPSEELLRRMMDLTDGYYAAAFSSLREELIAESFREDVTMDDDHIISVVRDRISPAISATRRIQVLYAKLNCTHVSLLPGVPAEKVQEFRGQWLSDIRRLKADQRLF